MGVARFLSNDIFYREMAENVRVWLLLLTGLALFLLLIVWRAVSSLVAKIRHSERNLHQLFEAAPFPMLLIDTERQIVALANRNAMEQMQVDDGSPLSLLALPLSEILAEVSTKGQIDDREIAIPLDSGGTRWAMISASRLASYNRSLVIIGIVDISTIRAAQSVLEVARERAEAASRAKSEFLATMSHEIRTPLNGILGMVQLLKRSDLDKQQQEYLDAIARSGEGLLILLNDILDLSRMEASRLELSHEPFDLDRVIEDLKSMMVPMAREKQLALRMEVSDEVPRFLSGDAARLRQILLNLVGNAIKFTNHGQVMVRVSATEPDANQALSLRFSVADTGIGIPVEMQSIIFERFTQGDQSISRRFGGAGLGLAIVKRLVNMMGGEIGVTSQPGQGSTFAFDVRVHLAQGQIQLPTRSGVVINKPEHALKILVAEDVDINRRVVKGLLNSEGHQVIEATNGREAVDAANAEAFDAILMDLQMPELDGYEATQLIRSGNGPSRNTPILALTANILKDEQMHCITVGMNGFIIKPFTLDKLMDELALVVGNRRSSLLPEND
jgi:signal transduction histidine kinase/CheY-like chemotaxis protein